MTQQEKIQECPEERSSLSAIDQIQGVFITIAPEMTDEVVSELQGWFAERDEVEIVDYGTTDKQELGFLLIEWVGYEIDPLFLTILEQRDDILDYTVYGRELEDE